MAQNTAKPRKANTPSTTTPSQIRIGPAWAMPEGTARASVISAVPAAAVRHMPRDVRYAVRNSAGRETGSAHMAAQLRVLYIQPKAAITLKSVTAAVTSTQGRTELSTA